MELDVLKGEGIQNFLGNLMGFQLIIVHVYLPFKDFEKPDSA